MKAIVLYSGGLDSTVLLYSLQDVVDCHALSFKYGSKHETQELRAAREVVRLLHIPHNTIELPKWVFGDGSQLLMGGPDVLKAAYGSGEQPTVVPFRNGVFLAVAVAFAEARGHREVFIASHASDAEGYAYPDCTPKFTSAFAKAVDHGTMGRVSIEQPFALSRKSDVAKLGAELDVPFELTWSCYSPQLSGEGYPRTRGRPNYSNNAIMVHCGECATCRERRKAFKEAGVDDPTKYATID